MEQVCFGKDKKNILTNSILKISLFISKASVRFKIPFYKKNFYGN